MAFWVVDGGRQLDVTGRGGYVLGGKRRVSHSDGTEDVTYKRKRLVADLGHDAYRPGPGPAYGHGRNYSYSHTFDDDFGFEHDHDYDRFNAPPLPLPLPQASLPPPPSHRPPPADSFAVNNLAFLVIRERSPTPEIPTCPGPTACAMERTESGLSISSDTSQHSGVGFGEDENDLSLLGDIEAARRVRDHVAGFRRRCPDSQHGRILRALINPKSREAEFPLDNDALRSIFSAANEIFFANRLAGRVAWDWSHPTSEQYQAHIVGTTALRRSRMGGYETLIVLSSPILKDTKYNRRLLISTFLHEMIHSYLFVTCGLKARECGGHTEGFRQIAETIDKWVGREYLRLRDMEADLERFRDDGRIIHEEHVHRSHSPWRRWHGHPNRERHDHYLQEPQPRRHPNHQEWQWYEEEGFRARNTHSSGGSPYVY